MSKVKTQYLNLTDLEVNLFVRKTLNQDHVLYLAELIENGVKLPPIEVAWLDGKWIVIDGRHRIEAHDLCKHTAIEAVVIEVVSETDLIAKAYQANVGGALPPTPQDTEHTVMLLLERGEAKKRIGELLGLPAGMARRYVNEVQSKLARSKIQRAAAAVTDGGLTVQKAAEQYNVDPEKLKEALSGSRGVRRKQGIVDVQRQMTKQYSSVSQKNSHALRRMIDKFDDGDVTEKQLDGIFTHLEKLQRQSTRKVLEWKKRFEAKKQEHRLIKKDQAA